MSADDCRDCIQAEALRGLREVVSIQNKSIEGLTDGLKESAADRQKIKIEQQEFKGEVKAIKSTLEGMSTSMNDFHKSTNDSMASLRINTEAQFKAIRDERMANIQKWKWQIIGTAFVIITGIVGSFVLMLMTYFREK